MSATVSAGFAAQIVVGPAAVHGRCADGSTLTRPDGELVAASLEFVDDDVALVGDEPIAVAELWCSVFGSMLRGVTGSVQLIVPSSWPGPRVEAVAAAASTVAGEPVVSRRAVLLATGDPPPAIIEIAGDVVVVCRGAGGAVIDLQCRDDRDPPALADVIARAAGGAAATLLIDCPTGVPQAAALATMIAGRLRALGRHATVIAGDDLLWAAPAAPNAVVDEPPRRLPARLLVSAGAAAVAGTAAVGLITASVIAEPPTPAAALFVEGRVALQVPPDWSVQRITAGAGSARVQFTSPADSAATLHLTQAPLPPGQGLAEVSDTLRRAVSAAPPGTFDGFDDAAHHRARPVIRYRENRPGRSIDWTVFVDGDVRIGIGCQRPTQQPVDDPVCAAAVATARVVALPARQ